MIPDAAPDDNPLVQDAPDHRVDDPAITQWFLTALERRNPETDLRVFTTGNLVAALVDGHDYFVRLCAELQAAGPGDQIYFLDFRGDWTSDWTGPGLRWVACWETRPNAAWPSSGCCGARTHAG